MFDLRENRANQIWSRIYKNLAIQIYGREYAMTHFRSCFERYFSLLYDSKTLFVYVGKFSVVNKVTVCLWWKIFGSKH